MLAFSITQQMIFSGLIAGMTYAVFAAGFVLIYRCTGVLNFAQGEIGAFGAALLMLLVINYNIPYWISLALVITACALIGTAIELSVVRREKIRERVRRCRRGDHDDPLRAAKVPGQRQRLGELDS